MRFGDQRMTGHGASQCEGCDRLRPSPRPVRTSDWRRAGAPRSNAGRPGFVSAQHCDAERPHTPLLRVRLPGLTGADGKTGRGGGCCVARRCDGRPSHRCHAAADERSAGSWGRTWPQAAKIPIVATSTEVVDWMFHWDPRVAYPYWASRAEPKKPSTCSGVKPSHMSACSARIHS
jgi:hypothetical protein